MFSTTRRTWTDQFCFRSAKKCSSERNVHPCASSRANGVTVLHWTLPGRREWCNASRMTWSTRLPSTTHWRTIRWRSKLCSFRCMWWWTKRRSPLRCKRIDDRAIHGLKCHKINVFHYGRRLIPVNCCVSNPKTIWTCRAHFDSTRCSAVCWDSTTRFVVMSVGWMEANGFHNCFLCSMAESMSMFKWRKAALTSHSRSTMLAMLLL